MYYCDLWEDRSQKRPLLTIKITGDYHGCDKFQAGPIGWRRTCRKRLERSIDFTVRMDENLNRNYKPIPVFNNNMKNLILVLTVAAFAIASTAQAGEKAVKNKSDKSDCSASAQTSSCSAKSTAAVSKSACCASAKQAKKLAPVTARGTLVAQK
jgi:hypothetical protein